MSPHVDFILGRTDAANIRFGISAPHELVRAIVVLQEPSHHPLQWAWLRAVRDTIRGDRNLLGALELLGTVLAPRQYTPDFLTPTPQAPAGPVDQIRAIADTTTDNLIRDLTKSHDLAHGSRRTTISTLIADPAATRQRFTDAMRTAWDKLLAPVWPQAVHVLNADLAHRSRQIVTHGAGAVINSLHERVSWHDGTVRVRTSIWSETLDCQGTGLLLVPSVFSWPAAQVLTDPPHPPTIFYPAHAVTEAWPHHRTDHTHGLQRALGTGRATILMALVSPTSTTEIAATAGLSAPTATHHLSVLRAAGLITSTRTGREMLHTRTTLGDALANGAL